MMLLYDEEEIMKSYMESEVYESKIEMVKRMLEDGILPIDKIAQIADFPIKTVLHLAEAL